MRGLTWLRSALILAGLACACGAQAGINTWTPVGPEGGYARAVAFDLVQSDVLFTVAGSSIYRSTDRGQNWTAVRDDLAIGSTRILIDPTNPNLVLTLGVGFVYRSDDGGLSFAKAAAPAAAGTTSTLATAAMSADGSALYVTTVEGKVYRSTDFGIHWEERSEGLPQQLGSFVRDLVVDPGDPNVLYALVESAGLYGSIDAGQHWALKNALDGIGGLKLAIDPGMTSQLLLATGQALYASQDSGATWSPEPPVGQFVWVGYQPAEPSALVGAAMAVSDNGPVVRRAARGDTWSNGQPLKLIDVQDAEFDPKDVDPTDCTLLVASSSGPLLSEDGGDSFTVLSRGIRAASVGALAAANDPQSTVYVAYSMGPVGVYKRTSSGWQPVDNDALLARMTSAFNPTAIAVAPDDPDNVFVASGSVVHSDDGGQSWSAPDAALPTTSALAFDPSNSQTLYAGTYLDGLYRSDDQGLSWQTRSSGPPESIDTLLVDPANPGTVYAADQNPQASPPLFKTTDGGMNWAPASSGLDIERIVALGSDPANHVIYAGGVGTGEGLFESTDGGQSWTRAGSPAGNAYALAIAVDPDVPTTLIIAPSPFGYGAARSVDGGATWEDIDLNLGGPARAIRKLVLDPQKPNIIIASDDNYGLIELEVSPDLDVTLTPASASLPIGGTGSATVHVTNLGPYAASAVKLVLSLPAGTSAPVPSPTQGTCAPTGDVIECSLGALRVNQKVEAAVMLTGVTAAQGTLDASVSGHESDPAEGDNTASMAVVTKSAADLGVTLAPTVATVDQGDSVTLKAVATNVGPHGSDDAVVVIGLGDGFSYESATPSQGTCEVSGSTVTCNLGTIDAGGQATIDVGTTANGAGVLAATAQIADDTVYDPAAQNDSMTANVTSKVAANPPPSPPAQTGPSGGGGGGGGGPLELLALIALIGVGRQSQAGPRP